MGFFPTVEVFVLAHRLCGQGTWTAPPPTPKGYRLRIVCPCGAVFDCWITPEAAEGDLLHTSLCAFLN